MPWKRSCARRPADSEQRREKHSKNRERPTVKGSMAWELERKKRDSRRSAERPADASGALRSSSRYRRLVTLQSEANERAWNYWAASIVRPGGANGWYQVIEAANAMWQRQQQQKEEQRQRMATIAKGHGSRVGTIPSHGAEEEAAQEWNREMENQGGSRPGSAFTWADATPRDTARSESHFSPRGGLDTARSDATDVSDISDAGRFVDEFDADDKQDVEKLFRAVRHGRRDAIRQYTEKGFDVNLRNKHGHLAMVAAQNNQKAILKQLYRLLVIHQRPGLQREYALHYAQMRAYATGGVHGLEARRGRDAREPRRRVGLDQRRGGDRGGGLTLFCVIRTSDKRPRAASAGGHAGVARPARAQSSEDVPGRLLGRNIGCAGGPRVLGGFFRGAAPRKNHRLSEQKLPDQHAGVRRRQRAPVQQPTQVTASAGQHRAARQTS